MPRPRRGSPGLSTGLSKKDGPQVSRLNRAELDRRDHQPGPPAELGPALAGFEEECPARIAAAGSRSDARAEHAHRVELALSVMTVPARPARPGCRPGWGRSPQPADRVCAQQRVGVDQVVGGASSTVSPLSAGLIPRRWSPGPARAGRTPTTPAGEHGPSQRGLRRAAGGVGAEHDGGRAGGQDAAQHEQHPPGDDPGRRGPRRDRWPRPPLSSTAKDIRQRGHRGSEERGGVRRRRNGRSRGPGARAPAAAAGPDARGRRSCGPGPGPGPIPSPHGVCRDN